MRANRAAPDPIFIPATTLSTPQNRCPVTTQCAPEPTSLDVFGPNEA
jgi:hypothetical protein